MKKSIVLSLAAVLSLSGINMLSAGGGDAFVGGMAGSMVGSAIFQPREKTVVVQQPVKEDSSDEDYRSLEKRNNELQRKNEELERRLQRLEEKSK